MKAQKQTSEGEQPFTFQSSKPYSTFISGKPRPVPYVVDGLLTEGGFSILAGKSKQGKSSLSRFLAVRVAKGQPFLGRKAKRGEVFLLSVEDSLDRVDPCLQVLEYDPEHDCTVRIVERSASSFADNLHALEQFLKTFPETKLVIIDTLQKFVRVEDLNDQVKVQIKVEPLRNLARDYHVHIMGIHHLKKVNTDDPFDQMSGSFALRAEADTNIILYQKENGERVIAAETRTGVYIPKTTLTAETCTIPGEDADSVGTVVVKSFSLGQREAERKAQNAAKKERKQRLDYEGRLIEHLEGCPGKKALQQDVLEEVSGKTENLLAAIHKLEKKGTLEVTGTSHSPTDPLMLNLIEDKMGLQGFLDHMSTKGSPQNEPSEEKE
jgi:hypothetical protein